MFLRSVIVFLCLLAEIGFGIYTYLHFDSLLTRFVFFVFTAAVVAMIVIKIANTNFPKRLDENVPGTKEKVERKP